ncbi:hypothetical protein EYC59_03270 [Candidatus Saccharibacteria bacterium]|nr:MAG: hypothetical protein EYC59_03270 [Candidatus Saccharibacteria bacterium]
MPESQKQLVERIKQAQNVLVTVSKNPSVDQLAAAIGLTLALNHIGKHGTAVFSGQVPSTLEFLRPEETLEKNTDSLRDFIIALDKSKADKLRYKVEDNVVRIFITPYRASISDKDLQFSQGDFNVEVVIALGVDNQQDLDEAITAHGRILHDATVATVNTHAGSELGSIGWFDEQASSLSEMVVGLIGELDKKALDNQMATALLTGIVAATERFRNEKTSPRTMSVSAELMGVGADQQLVASKLEAPATEPASSAEDNQSQPDEKRSSLPDSKPPTDPGTLEIEHSKQKKDTLDKVSEDKPAPVEEPESALDPTMPLDDMPKEEPGPQVRVDESGQLITEQPLGEEGSGPDHLLPKIGPVHGTPTQEFAPPVNIEAGLPVDAEDSQVQAEDTDTLTANTHPESFDPPTEQLVRPEVNTPVLEHDAPTQAQPILPSASMSDAPADMAQSQQAPLEQSLPPLPPTQNSENIALPQENGTPSFVPTETLQDLEEALDSPHLDAAPETSDLDSARDAVQAALNGAGPSDTQAPITALNAQPFGDPIRSDAPATTTLPVAPLPNAGFNEPTPGNTPADNTLDMPLPSFGGGQSGTIPANPLIPSAQGGIPAAPSVFPGAPQPAATNPGNSGTPPPPPVPPPPILPPVQ